MGGADHTMKMARDNALSLRDALVVGLFAASAAGSVFAYNKLKPIAEKMIEHGRASVSQINDANVAKYLPR